MISQYSLNYARFTPIIAIFLNGSSDSSAHLSSIEPHERKESGLIHVDKAAVPCSIPISDRLLVVLTELKEKPYSETFVFATVTGRKIPERTALAKCKSAAAKAGIERAKLHKCRSSFASHFVMSGVLIQDVSRLLGHHSISETEAAYAYLVPTGMKPQVNVICQVDIVGKNK